MNTHGIEVLYRADNHNVVFLVAHNFKFILFPPESRFLDKHLAYRTQLKSFVEEFDKLFFIVCNAAACPSECKGRPEYCRETDGPYDVHTLTNADYGGALRNLQPYL